MSNSSRSKSIFVVVFVVIAIDVADVFVVDVAAVFDDDVIIDVFDVYAAGIIDDDNDAEADVDAVVVVVVELMIVGRLLLLLPLRL